MISFLRENKKCRKMTVSFGVHNVAFFMMFPNASTIISMYTHLKDQKGVGIMVHT